MEDWQKRLMEKTAGEMRAGREELNPRDYSEGIMWYSDERLLEIAPDIKIYKLSNSDLFDANNNLYIRTSGGFDLLGKTSELLDQLDMKRKGDNNEVIQQNNIEQLTE